MSSFASVRSRSPEPAADSRPITIATSLPGLRLVSLSLTDLAPYYALVDASRAHLTQHGDYLDLGEATRESLAADLADPAPATHRFGIWQDVVLVGRIDLNPRTQADVVLGYWLGAAYTGHGYATAAGEAAITYARSALGAGTIWAGVTKGNLASEAVLARLGFRFVSDQGSYHRFARSLIGTGDDHDNARRSLLGLAVESDDGDQ